METKNRISSLREFLIEYQSGLKALAPVKTGRLRDSILVKRPTLAADMNIQTDAIDYAIYANNKHHFVERNDFRIDDFADDIADSLWDDFFTDNKTPNN